MLTPTPSDSEEDKARRRQVEAHYTSFRIRELYLDPVRGRFDSAHLREINRRIFQDLPGYGYTDVTPGRFRDPVPAGKDWIKTRRLESVGVTTHVAYSSMDGRAQAQLDKTLASIDVPALRELDAEPFSAALGKLYAELDYIHPFPDGNSRTLREFTRQLAGEAGYNLEWERFTVAPAGRDLLYIARDLSVMPLAMPHVHSESTSRQLLHFTAQFEGNRLLPDLMRDIVKPRQQELQHVAQTDLQKAVALGQAAAGLAVDVRRAEPGQTYAGELLGVTERYLVQHAGGRVILHEKARVIGDAGMQPGQAIEIRYPHGAIGLVETTPEPRHQAEQQQEYRPRGPELGG